MYFNPRTSNEVRQKLPRRSDLSGDFNPRTSNEVRQALGKLSHFSVEFQSTHLKRGATNRLPY